MLVENRHHRRDDDDLVDAGGDGFDPVVEVRRVSTEWRGCTASMTPAVAALRPGAPHHLVAAHQAADAAAPQVAAVDGTIACLDIRVLAETADHHPFDGGAEQGVIHHCGAFFAAAARGWPDAPLLTQIEFCFLPRVCQFMNRFKAMGYMQIGKIPPFPQ